MTDEVAKRGRLPSPDKAWEAFVNRLPSWIGDTLWNLSMILRWLLLPTAFLSVVVDLRPVIDFASWLLAHAGSVRASLESLGDAAHSLVQSWRAFTAPLLDWFRQWIPFAFPRWAFDLLSILLVSLPAILQYLIAAAIERRLVNRWLDRLPALDREGSAEYDKLAEELRALRETARELKKKKSDEAGARMVEATTRIAEIEAHMRNSETPAGRVVATTVAFARLDADKREGARLRKLIAQVLLIVAVTLSVLGLALLGADWWFWPSR